MPIDDDAVAVLIDDGDWRSAAGNRSIPISPNDRSPGRVSEAYADAEGEHKTGQTQRYDSHFHTCTPGLCQIAPTELLDRLTPTTISDFAALLFNVGSCVKVFMRFERHRGALLASLP